MSKFSNYLKTLIENSGESIAFLSRTLNIERTSIQHYQMSVFFPTAPFRLWRIILI